jgi:hypothetical protein
MHSLFCINKKKFESFFNTLKVLNNINEFLAKKIWIQKKNDLNNRKKEIKIFNKWSEL